MLGLGDYDSDDEESAPQQATEFVVEANATKAADALKDRNRLISEPSANEQFPIPDPEQPTDPVRSDATITEPNTDVHEGDQPRRGSENEKLPSTDTYAKEGSLSPYSSNLLAIQNLTMPPFPNFEIPPSPPGSPPMAASKKFTQFLALKKKGVHFNQKLAANPALKNPALLKRQLEFAGLSEADQYTNTLPEVMVPTAFPDFAYVDHLNKAQEKLRKRRELDASKVPREGLDFVPAAASSASAKGNIATGPPSKAERIMAGLDRNSSTTERAQRGIERRGGRFDQRARGRSRSRSPPRRR